METIVIAEIGWNHMGDMDLAKNMILKAKESGASIAKFQTWQVYKLKSGEWDYDGRKEIYLKAELNEDDHKLLMKYCKDSKIEFMSSAFSVEDAKLLKNLKCNQIKIPSFEINNLELLTIAKQFQEDLSFNWYTRKRNECGKNLFKLEWH